MSPAFIAEHFATHSKVVEQSAEQLSEQVETVARVLVDALSKGQKVLAFGNGGSAAQASHLVGELLGRFAMTRQPFPAIALTVKREPSLASAMILVTKHFSKGSCRYWLSPAT